MQHNLCCQVITIIFQLLTYKLVKNPLTINKNYIKYKFTKITKYHFGSVWFYRNVQLYYKSLQLDKWSNKQILLLWSFHILFELIKMGIRDLKFEWHPTLSASITAMHSFYSCDCLGSHEPLKCSKPLYSAYSASWEIWCILNQSHSKSMSPALTFVSGN